MDNALAVKVDKSLEHLGDVEEGERLRQLAEAGDNVGQTAVLDKLHDHVDVLVRLHGRVVLDNAPMVESTEKVDL